MSNQRIAAVNPPYSSSLEESFAVVMPPGIPPLNIFRTVGQNPRVLSRMVKGGLLDKGSINIAQRELVILRVCALCGAEYEWGVHVAAFANKAGFSQAQIADTCQARPTNSLWSAEQRLLFDLVRELHEQSTITDETWAALTTYFNDEQMIELVMLVGLYHAVSFTVNAVQITKEPFAPSFPRTGTQ